MRLSSSATCRAICQYKTSGGIDKVQREQFLPAAKPRAKAQSQESIGPGVKINTHTRTHTLACSLFLSNKTLTGKFCFHKRVKMVPLYHRCTNTFEHPPTRSRAVSTAFRMGKSFSHNVVHWGCNLISCRSLPPAEEGQYLLLVDS